MRLLKLICLISTAVFFQNCASSYTVSDPTTRTYLSSDSVSGVTLKYKYGVLQKKYAKKESKKDIKVIAVRLENNSSSTYTVGDNLMVANDKGYVYSLYENKEAFKLLKQKPASHLFYLLLTPLNILSTSTNSRGMTETEPIFPIGLILGPGIAGGNMIVAGSANKKFKTDLEKNNVLGKTIAPGETLDGLLIINSTTFESLKLNLK